VTVHKHEEEIPQGGKNNADKGNDFVLLRTADGFNDSHCDEQCGTYHLDYTAPTTAQVK